ncbi:MAG: hypothetical protein IKF96_07760 [Eggerthellaceae bacterium]|nr:hypothetical protein [Eggerthellaceae bacterium]
MDLFKKKVETEAVNESKNSGQVSFQAARAAQKTNTGATNASSDAMPQPNTPAFFKAVAQAQQAQKASYPTSVPFVLPVTDAPAPAAAVPAPAPAASAPAKPIDAAKTVEQVAREVINGDYGNGSARKAALEAAGYDYDVVQAKVNELLGITPPAEPEPPKPELKPVEEIAREVIKGMWGNGSARKAALEEAGYNYAEVQAKVNELL